MTETSDSIAQLSDAMTVAQGVAFAACHIVREMLVDVAKLHPDPEKYIKSLFDRVADRFDPVRPYGEKEVASFARDQIGSIFRDALSTLQNIPTAGPRPGAHRPPT